MKVLEKVIILGLFTSHPVSISKALTLDELQCVDKRQTTVLTGSGFTERTQAITLKPGATKRDNQGFTFQSDDSGLLRIIKNSDEYLPGDQVMIGLSIDRKTTSNLIISNIHVCGDGAVTDPCEECDDGNALSGDGCDSNCDLESNGGDDEYGQMPPPLETIISVANAGEVLNYGIDFDPSDWTSSETTVYYSSPSGSNSNDGITKDKPKGPLSSFPFGILNNGDLVIALYANGANHGSFSLINRTFNTPVTIISESPDLAARVGTATLEKVQGVNIVGLYFDHSTLLVKGQSSTDIRIDNNRFEAGVGDSTSWRINLYNNGDGDIPSGAGIVISNNRVFGGRDGFLSRGAKVIGNWFDHLLSDGVRIGSNGIAEKNAHTNCVADDDEHADAFQAYGGVAENFIIRNNVIMHGTYSYPWTLGKSLQCFVTDSVRFIEYSGNLCITKAQHCLDIENKDGASEGNAAINNTCVNPFGDAQGRNNAYINFRAHNGVPQPGTVRKNNLQGGGQVSDSGTMDSDGNYIVHPPDYAQIFQDIGAFDARLRVASDNPVIDQGVLGSDVPSEDLWETARTCPDIGGHEGVPCK